MGIVAGIITIIGATVGVLAANGVFSKVTICTKMDYRGDIGPCIETKTVEIVANPDNYTDCPTDTEPAYDIKGGIVGTKFVGCAKK